MFNEKYETNEDMGFIWSDLSTTMREAISEFMSEDKYGYDRPLLESNYQFQY